MAARYIERFVLTLLLFLALSNTIARAGDAATRDIIGFSPDGRYFAFEQHGIQDGSGFPYAEIFVIDAAEDRWVPGTPIRKRADDEKAKAGNAGPNSRFLAVARICLNNDCALEKFQ
jgi:predicted secreted protein